MGDAEGGSVSLTKLQAVTFARELLLALVDEYDKLEGGDRVFYKAWLRGLPDDVILGVATRGEPLPEWTGPLAPGPRSSARITPVMSFSTSPALLTTRAPLTECKGKGA